MTTERDFWKQEAVRLKKSLPAAQESVSTPRYPTPIPEELYEGQQPLNPNEFQPVNGTSAARNFMVGGHQLPISVEQTMLDTPEAVLYGSPRIISVSKAPPSPPSADSLEDREE